jgi:ABC-type Mn2+/Zn2+ transport system permease subunit
VAEGENVIFLPRIAKTLHHPMLAAFLGLVLLAIGIYGLATKDIPKWWSIIIIVVGALNLLRLLAKPNENQAAHS